jgi:hypothetical protein
MEEVSMRGLLKALLLACAVVLVPAIAHAQVGAIAGVVPDASNAVM